MKHYSKKKCRELLSALSDYIDGDIEESLCSELETHLSFCKDCRIFLETLKMTIDIYSEERHLTISDELHNEVHSYLRIKLKKS